jgi:dihydroorotate dehydrogenase
MLYSAFRPALFTLDPERAHRLALDAARIYGRLPGRPLRGGSGVDLMGLRFPNRVGLAAGFDKNAEAVDGLGKLGFGFIEVGTVTPRPQSGHSRPRLFRLPSSGALVNRLGFPNQGAATVARRLRRRRYGGIVGVNIGKHADTPIDRAVDDYVLCLRAVCDVADYVAVNVSSPNTASLRELHRPERLEPLLSALLSEREIISRERHRHVPILLKISPDLALDSLKDIAEIASRVPLDGIIATNTTVSRDASMPDSQSRDGGLSGAPLYPLSLRVVATLRRLLGPAFPLVGVGGVDSAAKARAMRSAGADLVQIYTGLIYRGPALVAECVRALRGVVHE